MSDEIGDDERKRDKWAVLEWRKEKYNTIKRDGQAKGSTEKLLKKNMENRQGGREGEREKERAREGERKESGRMYTETANEGQ